MRRLLLLFLMLSILGCASVPEPNPWTERERVEEAVTYPIPPQELSEDLSNLGAVLEASLGNYDIAQENAQALASMSRAYNAALDAGEAEHDRTEALRVMLEDERRARIYDKVSWWSIIAAGLVIGISR